MFLRLVALSHHTLVRTFHYLLYHYSYYCYYHIIRMIKTTRKIFKITFTIYYMVIINVVTFRKIYFYEDAKEGFSYA